MWHFRHIRHPLTAAAAPGALLAALLLAPAWPARAVPPQDPVEELRRELRHQAGEAYGPLALDYRKETLKKRLGTLNTLADLRRALALTEWKDMPGQPVEIAAIDRGARAEIGKKFRDAVKAVVDRGDADARVAVADMLGEMGPEVRSLNAKESTGFGRSLTPELVLLARDKRPEVRAAAARALGKVFPDPKTAALALKTILEGDTTTTRRAAAQGLVSMIQVVSALQKTGRAQTGVEALGPDVLDAARWVIDVANPGLAYTDARVRGRTLEAVLKATNAFREQIPDPYEPGKFAPVDRPLTAPERKEIRLARERLRNDEARFAPIVQGIRKLAQPLARLLTDSDAVVRLEARRALESIGEARLRLQRLEASVPTLPTEKTAAPLVPVSQKGEEGKDDPLTQAIEPGLHVIARGLRDPDWKARLATVEFLETLEDAAAPAVPVLVESLGDANRFVRWAAARAFAKIGPVRLGVVVPDLALLLRDRDVDVAKQAATTLESYGDKAAAAVPALAQTVALADPEVRVAAMKTLIAVGPAAGVPAVPALVTALGHRDAEVRKTAAEVLGKIGPRARDAVPALRVAGRDDSSMVRRAASDAVLSILAPSAAK